MYVKLKFTAIGVNPTYVFFVWGGGGVWGLGEVGSGGDFASAGYNATVTPSHLKTRPVRAT